MNASRLLLVVVAVAASCCVACGDDCSGPERVLRVTAADLGGDCPPSFVAGLLAGFEADEFRQGNGESCGTTTAHDFLVSSDGTCIVQISVVRRVSAHRYVDEFTYSVDPEAKANEICSMLCTHRVKVSYE